MSIKDRQRWDQRYAERDLAPVGKASTPFVFAACADLLPSAGLALEIACGRGQAALWLAARGMQVHAVDISPVAICQARSMLAKSDYAERVRFEVCDLDQGLPAGPPCALLLCHNFRDARLDRPMLQRLAPGGRLAFQVELQDGRRLKAKSWATDPRPRVAQPWLARAFFLRFASLRLRFTLGFS